MLPSLTGRRDSIASVRARTRARDNRISAQYAREGETPGWACSRNRTKTTEPHFCAVRTRAHARESRSTPPAHLPSGAHTHHEPEPEYRAHPPRGEGRDCAPIWGEGGQNQRPERAAQWPSPPLKRLRCIDCHGRSGPRLDHHLLVGTTGLPQSGGLIETLLTDITGFASTWRKWTSWSPRDCDLATSQARVWDRPVVSKGVWMKSFVLPFALVLGMAVPAAASVNSNAYKGASSRGTTTRRAWPPTTGSRKPLPRADGSIPMP